MCRGFTGLETLYQTTSGISQVREQQVTGGVTSQGHRKKLDGAMLSTWSTSHPCPKAEGELMRSSDSLPQTTAAELGAQGWLLLSGTTLSPVPEAVCCAWGRCYVEAKNVLA